MLTLAESAADRVIISGGLMSRVSDEKVANGKFPRLPMTLSMMLPTALKALLMLVGGLKLLPGDAGGWI